MYLDKSMDVCLLFKQPKVEDSSQKGELLINLLQEFSLYKYQG